VTIKALFLDMDHTLCDTAKADELGVQQLAKSLNAKQRTLHPDESLNLIRYFMGLLYRPPEQLPKSEGEIEHDYRSRLLQWAIQGKTGIQHSHEQCGQWMQELMDSRMLHFDFFDGAKEKLQTWRKSYRTVVLTNGPLYSQRPKVERVDMANHVDRVVLAGEHPWQKPDPKIFQWTLEQEGLQAHEVLHVGDSLASDIAGAKAANIPCVWINPNMRSGPQEPKPDHVIPNINDLDAILERL
jgi:HAD superfamily hydrolase (TIGR01549 family)